MPGELPSSVVASICFVGRSGGLVKSLGGFKKAHHTLPDAVNAATNGFLARICEIDLTRDAEALFQAARAGLGYKRREISLGVASPTATLVARDFTAEILYAFEDGNPARYALTTTLRELRSAELARRDEFSRIFAGRFAEISFALKKGARVEAVIDAIEALDDEGGLSVQYPSDYRDCIIRVDGVGAEVRCTGASLDVIFPRAGTPGELIEAFAAVRGAFGISKALSALIE
jgi:hypothetical protein